MIIFRSNYPVLMVLWLNSKDHKSSDNFIFTNFIPFEIASMSMEGCQISTPAVEPWVNYLKKGPTKFYVSN